MSKRKHRPNKPQYSKLIRCSDHKYAPWCVVCVHIMDGTTKECVRVPMSPGEQDDWLCPSCFRKGPDALELDDLRAVCIHCARALVKELRHL